MIWREERDWKQEDSYQYLNQVSHGRVEDMKRKIEKT